MDPINPWLDPSQVRQLAETLIRPVDETQLAPKSPGFDTSFVGFLNADESSVEENISSQPAPKPPIPAEKFSPPASPPTSIPAQSIPATPPTPQPEAKAKPIQKITPNPRPATTLLDSRFFIFRDWLALYFSAKELFILDQSASVIFDESHHGRLHFIARDLILQTGQPHNVRVNFGPTANLELITCNSPLGFVVIGALFPASLHSNQITSIQEALTQSLAS